MPGVGVARRLDTTPASAFVLGTYADGIKGPAGEDRQVFARRPPNTKSVKRRKTSCGNGVTFFVALAFEGVLEERGEDAEHHAAEKADDDD